MLRIAHLYPLQLNLYGDRGNIACLVNRCRWRDIDVEVTELGPGDTFEHDAYDLVFVGGGSDSGQESIALDLRSVKGDGLRRAVDNGVVVLAVCGGYQLLGHYYRPAVGQDLVGLGLLDLTTEHPGPEAPRCIGNIVIEWNGNTIVGFENHGGRTRLGPDIQPLGKVLAGHGNNGQDGAEGARYKNVFGTYIHGSLLPKNPAFTDHILKLALERRGEAERLTPLDDTLEQRAHEYAVRLAKSDAKPPRFRLPF